MGAVDKVCLLNKGGGGGGLLTNKGGCVLTKFKVSLLDKGGGGCGQGLSPR